MRCLYQGTLKDGNGKIITSGTITVYLAGTNTLANIYTTLVGTTAVNSTTSSTITGNFAFYIDRFDYDCDQKFKLVLSKGGFTSQTYDNIEIDQVVLQTYTLTEDKTVTTHLVIPKGVIYDGAYTLTLNGSVEIGLYQVFGSSITVVFGTGSVTEIHYQWFNSDVKASASVPPANYFLYLSTGISSNGYTGLGGIIFDNITYSGLTAGQIVRATSATAASFGALDLADTDAVTGILPYGNVGAGGADTQLQYNNGGVLGGMQYATFNDVSGLLQIDYNTEFHGGTTKIDGSLHVGWDTAGVLKFRAYSASPEYFTTIYGSTLQAANIAWYLPDAAPADNTFLGAMVTGVLSWVDIFGGRAGGLSIYGGTASGEDLTFYSTSHATKGQIYFGSIGYFDESAAIYKQLNIGAGNTLDPNYDNYATVWIHRNLDADGNNEYGFVSSVDVLSSFGPTGEKEKGAIIGEIRNQAGSSGANIAAAVGVLGSGTIYNTSTGRVWGIVGNGVVDAAANGISVGAEFGSINMAAAQSSIDTTTSKYAVWLTALIEGGANPSTAAICMSNAEATAFYYGFYMRWIATAYLYMSDPSAANARGIDFTNDANWSDAIIRLANGKNIYSRNAADNDSYQLIGLGTDNGVKIGTANAVTIELGYGATDDNPIYIRVGAEDSKQIVVGAADSGGVGFKMLRVAN